MIIYVNGERTRDVTARPSRCLDLGPGSRDPAGVAVAVDGEVVPRSRHADIELDDGAGWRS